MVEGSWHLWVDDESAFSQVHDRGKLHSVIHGELELGSHHRRGAGELQVDLMEEVRREGEGEGRRRGRTG